MKTQIDFSEFLEIEKKLDIRIGTVTEVVKMENSDKMLKLTVDFGSEIRTVMTNIGNRISKPEYLVGYQFPFIMNLKPVTMMGVESTAMIMVVENENKNLEFTMTNTKFSNGARLL